MKIKKKTRARRVYKAPCKATAFPSNYQTKVDTYTMEQIIASAAATPNGAAPTTQLTASLISPSVPAVDAAAVKDTKKEKKRPLHPVGEAAPSKEKKAKNEKKSSFAPLHWMELLQKPSGRRICVSYHESDVSSVDGFVKNLACKFTFATGKAANDQKNTSRTLAADVEKSNNKILLTVDYFTPRDPDCFTATKKKLGRNMVVFMGPGTKDAQYNDVRGTKEHITHYFQMKGWKCLYLKDNCLFTDKDCQRPAEYDRERREYWDKQTDAEHNAKMEKSRLHMEDYCAQFADIGPGNDIKGEEAKDGEV
jgi:hypothetical protein